LLPANATDKTVTWSVTNGSGQAIINATGLVTAVANGSVTSRATANDASAVVGTLGLTISGQDASVVIYPANRLYKINNKILLYNNKPLSLQI
jgi:uncharacterized protein YjdB